MATARKAAHAVHRTGGDSRWSRKVTRESHALDLENGVFAQDDPRRVARLLKRSAERSRRRKVDPFRSAMSMLTFYINRAGHALPQRRRRTLEAAKDELRVTFGRSKAHRQRNRGGGIAFLRAADEVDEHVACSRG